MVVQPPHVGDVVIVRSGLDPEGVCIGRLHRAKRVSIWFGMPFDALNDLFSEAVWDFYRQHLVFTGVPMRFRLTVELLEVKS